jgi:hypothetical protein
MPSTLQEAARYLKKYFYKKPRKWGKKSVDDIVAEYPTMSVAELIRIFFKDKHTVHDPRPLKEAVSKFEKPWVEVVDTKKTLTLRMGPFIGHFIGTKYEKKYIETCQTALKQPREGRELVVDLRYNGGGSDRVMLRALHGIEAWGRGTVLVSKNTASAGEMVAATLIHDYKFKRKGPRTAGMLSHMKNIILKDGSFLGVTTGPYTTPGGHKCKRFYL